MGVRRTVDRPYVLQPINGFSITAGTTAIALSVNTELVSTFIDSILIGVPSAEAQGIFFGNQGVSLASGFPIEPGTSINLRLSNERQMYEVQAPLLQLVEFFKCKFQEPTAIPFVIWDPSQVFVIAAAATDVRVVLFKSAYV